MLRLYHERMEKKAFRMSIVMLLRDLTPGERSKKIDELTKKEFDIPYSSKKTLSRATMYAWLKEYNENKDAGTVLMPKVRSDRGVHRVLTERQKQCLLRWRKDNPYRTCKKLLYVLLENNVATADNYPSESTIARFLRSMGMDRRTLLIKDKPGGKVRLAFEADYPNQLWMMDTKGPNLKVKDPHNEGYTITAMPIVVIDDFSRYIVAALYVYENMETEDTILQLLRKAIERYGVCDTLYCDRGGPYMGNKLKRTMELIGCRVLHTKKKDPEAKGKVEAVMKYFYETLETELMVSKGTCTIEQVNQYLNALLTTDYHKDKHSVTKEKPGERYFNFPEEYRRFVSMETITKIFLPHANAHVSKTGLIRKNNRDYLVQHAALYGTYVEIRWDPEDKEKVYVWYKDKYMGEAFLYVAENDFLKRELLQEETEPAKTVQIPSIDEVPPYNFLESKVAEYRMEKEAFENINDELLHLKKKKGKIQAELSNPGTNKAEQNIEGLSNPLSADKLIHLLSVLLKRKLSAPERFAVHVCWQQYGPFEEKLIRSVTGRLLGESHPVSDLTGYLNEIKLGSTTNLKGEK